MTSVNGTVRIGLSGWTYDRWRGVFYPEMLPHKRELRYAAERFPSLEVNGTFYRMQRPATFQAWAAEAPDDFVFSLKGPRFITHMKALQGTEAAMANFFASGPLALGRKLGPILWQLPARQAFDPGRLEGFLVSLPRDLNAAARLGEKHDARLKAEPFLDVPENRPLRHAIEIRHDSFRSPDFIALLRRLQIGLVVADTVDWPLIADLTADFVYCRLHGSKELYVSGYERNDLLPWAQWIEAWRQGLDPANAPHVCPPLTMEQGCELPRDVYVYFDNDAKVRAPVDAEQLIGMLGSDQTARRSI